MIVLWAPIGPAMDRPVGLPFEAAMMRHVPSVVPLACGHVDPASVRADGHAVDPERVRAVPEHPSATQVVGEQRAARRLLLSVGDVEPPGARRCDNAVDRGADLGQADRLDEPVRVVDGVHVERSVGDHVFEVPGLAGVRGQPRRRTTRVAHQWFRTRTSDEQRERGREKHCAHDREPAPGTPHGPSVAAGD